MFRFFTENVDGWSIHKLEVPVWGEKKADDS